ncbi:ATP-binding protein [Flavobacterium sp.]|uniref:ATP-binding protein n=1 Tax=Flavobacterium sp. TaxID=239 RepID=UPI00286B7321|nr:ATP-binding protein [Flavobacterium sp.]
MNEHLNIFLITDENFLKTIVRNLTANALKVTQQIENPSVIWKAWQKENNTYLSISDNGNGNEQEKFSALYDDKKVIGIKSGLGFHLIRDLAKAINCNISVDSKVNIGSTFTLKFSES